MYAETFKNFVRSWARSTGGALAILFALMAPILIAVIGMAMDVGITLLEKQRVQAALDASVVSAAATGETDVGELGALIRNYVEANYPGLLDSATLTLDVDGNLINVTVTGVKSSAPFGVLGDIDIETTSRIYSGVDRIEIAIAIDETGSLAYKGRRGKDGLDVFKEVTRDLVEYVADSVERPEKVKVGLAPFTAFVNVGPYGLGKTPDGDDYGEGENAGRAFVDTDRPYRPAFHDDRDYYYDTYDYDVGPDKRGDLVNRAKNWDLHKSNPPIHLEPGYFTGYLYYAPWPWHERDFHQDQYDGHSIQNYMWTPRLADWTGGAGCYNFYRPYLRESIYAQTMCAALNNDPHSGIWQSNMLTPLTPLTEDGSREYVLDQIEALDYHSWTPASLGGDRLDLRDRTHLIDPLKDPKFGANHNKADRFHGSSMPLAGLQWAYRLLTPDFPFEEGSPWGTPGVRRVLILMSDGETRTVNKRSFWQDGGTYARRDYNALNASIERTCQNAKDDGIQVYTVLFAVGNSTNEQRRAREAFENCATDPDTHFFTPDTIGELHDAFDQIAEQTVSLHIAG